MKLLDLNLLDFSSAFDRLFFDEEGYTTTGMVVSLLLVISMIFASAQVYRVNTASAAIQDVADACALAAENNVGQFMVVANVCDAVVLSLSLTSIAATGLGVAALCTPVTASVGTTLLNVGKQVSSARNSFSSAAKKTLNVFQKSLPFLAAASAQVVAQKNNSTLSESSYMALAVLVPWSADDIEIASGDDIEQAQGEADSKTEDLKRKAQEAEEAAKKMQESKQRAWQADCGANPSMCMYERAAKLGGLSGGDNPLYSSADTWSFSVALKRARAYYAARYANEAPASDSASEVANSALRKNMYKYAIEITNKSYVRETDTTFEAYLPILPKNTEEMRATHLYTDVSYPITVREDKRTMHATMRCPNVKSAGGASAFGSISQMEAGSFEKCDACEFSASSLGLVASANTNTQNGFEHYYRIVSEEAQNYAKAKKDFEPTSSEVKQEAQSLFDKLKEVLGNHTSYRIHATPPGSYGTIVMVVDTSQVNTNSAFSNSFVSGNTTLGTRAAVSGATLLKDSADSNNSVITQVLDGFRESGGVASGAAGIVLGCWNSFLMAYCNGGDAIKEGIDNAVSKIPFASVSGLGTWASKKFSEIIEGVGLEPANLEPLKPVIVNTTYIASEDDGAFAARFLQVKNATINVVGTTSMFESVITDTEETIASALNGDRELITIQPLGNSGPSIPITLVLPEGIRQSTEDELHDIANKIRGIVPKVLGGGSWI